MTAFKAHTCLVHPGRQTSSVVKIIGKELAGDGPLHDLLAKIFHAAPESRDFEVTFRKSSDGKQSNPVRDLIIAYQSTPSLETARKIAERLQGATDRRSGTGLLFLMTGQHATKFRTVLSRFPANEGILAQSSDSGFDVEFLEQVFIRQLSAYKALRLDDVDPSNAYWSGFATDRQAGAAPENMSDYWLDAFLHADFSETPKVGTLRLADALKRAVKETTILSIKDEIVSAVSLAPTALNGTTTSIDHFCDHFGLSEAARGTIISKLKKSSLSNKNFKFDPSEFKRVVPYRSVELESGAILKAPASDFSSIFSVEKIDEWTARYSTEGKISNQGVAR
jgi:hypothetical protein